MSSKDYVAIGTKDSSVSYPPTARLFCNMCGCNLISLDAQKKSGIAIDAEYPIFLTEGRK
jgi:hypothetical protein